MSPQVATCLYCGLITDTGGFRFSNTTSAALRLAGELVEAGANPADLARRTLTQRSLAAVLLEGHALSSLRPALDGRVLVASLSGEDLQATGAQPDDTEGIIDSFRDVVGVEVAVLFKEIQPGRWQVSLRAHETNVGSVAARFGGGGHRLAAGCTVKAELKEVEERIVHAVEATLREGEAGA